MSTWCLMLVTALYLFTAVDLLIKGNPPMSLTFFAYAVANLGIVWAIEKGFST